ALAIDVSTILAGKSSPEGILYSAGRDGLVLAWDIGAPTRPRCRKARGRVPATKSHRNGEWKAMTGWDEDEDDAESSGTDSDDASVSELGDVILDDLDDEPLLAGPRPHRDTLDKSIPFEKRWEVDGDRLNDTEIRSSFRVGVQSHSDWVNDIVLCNFNQSVISASNDGTVRIWSPHSPSSTMPSVLGRHSDYVRCLAHSIQQPWVASGSFDRSIKLWDLSRSASAGHLTSPISTLSIPESGAKASIYAVATNVSGSLIASGSPERVVRMWDPRAGKRVGKLVGHTDNIRSILMSDDGKYLLTGSSDASIKVWSLPEQRCLHTFAHHTDSVWSLFSSHPSLCVFYSGDRSGLVCKVDTENCGDITEGECIVLCRDSVHASLGKGQEGINKLVALDDWAVWTATGASDIRRWRDPGRRSSRMSRDNMSQWDHSTQPSNRETFGFCRAPSISRSSTPIAHAIPPNPHQSQTTEHTLFGIPFDSLVRLASPNQGYPFVGGLMPAHDSEVATLYSAASVLSVPLYHRSAPGSQNISQPPHPPQNPFHTFIQSASTTTFHASGPHGSPDVRSPQIAYEARELAVDALPLRTQPEGTLHGSHGLVRSVILNDRIHALTVDTAGEVAIWDLVRGLYRGYFSSEDVDSASREGSSAHHSHGGSVDRSPRESLETVRERIEGEAMIASWATVDTKMGSLTVHLSEASCFDAEVYADEAGFTNADGFQEEHRLNVGRWVLSNLFSGFLRAEAILSSNGPQVRRHRLSATPPVRGSSKSLHSMAGANNAHPTAEAGRLRSTSTTPGISATIAAANSLAHPRSHSNPDPPTIVIPPRNRYLTSDRHPSAATPSSPPSASASLTPRASASGKAGISSIDYFSSKASRSEHTVAAPSAGEQTSSEPIVPKSPETLDPPSTPMLHTPGGGLMGRLRSFGKTKRPMTSEGVRTPPPASGNQEKAEESPSVSSKFVRATRLNLQLIDTLLSLPMQGPSPLEAPPLELPAEEAVMISEQAVGESGWTILYHGLVSGTDLDVEAIEAAAPLWALECLLANKIPQPNAKVSFMVLPWNKGDAPALPELLSRHVEILTASRVIRIRKILLYVSELCQSSQEHVFLPFAHASGATAPPRNTSPHHDAAPVLPRYSRAVESFEILCNDMVLPVNMTLAAVRHYVWRQSGELVMHYRRRVPPALPSGPP
ncbi:hypothetical protein BS47DRAFT_1300152, partial [Hydnum rufescens UP504]